MKTDSSTGDLPRIYGESNLDGRYSITSRISIGHAIRYNEEFLLTGSSQLEVPTGAELKLGGGAYLTSSDITSLGADYPMINVDGGLVTVSAAAT